MKNDEHGHMNAMGHEAMQPAVEPRGDIIPPLCKPPEMADTLRLLESIRRMPAIRLDKVQRMRALIATDALVTPERIAGTVKRLLEELTP
ncbi:MAG: hypothetical protein QF662_05035 [Phycisphaerae bacterium]|nr:hypothetical protein [Phycisphaerae bacterium]